MRISFLFLTWVKVIYNLTTFHQSFSRNIFDKMKLKVWINVDLYVSNSLELFWFVTALTSWIYQCTKLIPNWKITFLKLSMSVQKVLDLPKKEDNLGFNNFWDWYISNTSFFSVCNCGIHFSCFQKQCYSDNLFLSLIKSYA